MDKHQGALSWTPRGAPCRSLRLQQGIETVKVHVAIICHKQEFLSRGTFNDFRGLIYGV